MDDASVPGADAESAVPVQVADTETALRACFAVFSELRPHLTQDGFVEQAKRQAERHGYTVAYAKAAGEVVAVAGFRVAESMSWGRYLYVDDLVTASAARRRGYGGLLMDWLLAEAKRRHCAQLHLDSGSQRHAAHRLYLNKGLVIGGFHFAAVLE